MYSEIGGMAHAFVFIEYLNFAFVEFWLRVLNTQLPPKL